ncbi:MAG: hypothetical protein CO189_04445 [candidate division Zixibacteria bacterium CG_4_9_14_3_um_filter_46_8]|nr:MAG: hypothetical protein CO189_04445 [candidate division Zixibacteria bacterium CG_4_9_14_3_um_filter_46_8]
MYFKPHSNNIFSHLRGWFNYYIRYKFRCFIQMDSYSVVMRSYLKEMKLIDRWNLHKLQIEPIVPRNAEKLYALVYPWRRRELRELLENNSLCFVGKLNGKIISYSLNSIGGIDPKIERDLGLEIPMGPRDVWGVDIVVAPPARGKGVEFSIFKNGSEFWRSMGMEYLYASVSLRDRGSLKMHKRVGFKPIYIHYLRRRFGFQKSQLMPIDNKSVAIAERAAKGANISFLWK